MVFKAEGRRQKAEEEDLRTKPASPLPSAADKSCNSQNPLTPLQHSFFRPFIFDFGSVISQTEVRIKSRIEGTNRVMGWVGRPHGFATCCHLLPPAATCACCSSCSCCTLWLPTSRFASFETCEQRSRQYRDLQAAPSSAETSTENCNSW